MGQDTQELQASAAGDGGPQGDDKEQGSSEVQTGADSQTGANAESTGTDVNATDETSKAEQPPERTKSMTEQEHERFIQLFHQFDTTIGEGLESGHDQQLNLLEFTNLLRSEFVKTGIEPAHLDAQAKKVFAKLDTNGNGFIDLEEYKRGIKQIKTFLHPHNNAARAAEGLAHTAANLPVGGPLVKVT